MLQIETIQFLFVSYFFYKCQFAVDIIMDIMSYKNYFSVLSNSTLKKATLIAYFLPIIIIVMLLTKYISKMNVNFSIYQCTSYYSKDYL